MTLRQPPIASAASSPSPARRRGALAFERVRRRLACAAGTLLATLFVIGAIAGGCSQQQRPAHEYGKVDVKIGSRTFRLEIAATEADRAYGLMNRATMPPDRGMLFVFPDEKPLDFYMRNTLIPLDIIYVSSSGTVVSIKHGKPMDESHIPSGGPARYVIELNDGIAAAAGLKPGDHIELPPAAKNPPGLE